MLEPSARGTTTKGSRANLVLALIVLLGLVLRLAAMHGRSLMDDEVRIAQATEHSYHHLLTSFGGAITQPALLLSSKFCQETLGGLIGLETAMRLPALVFGLLGIVVIWRLAQRVAGPTVGLWAALLMAVNPFHVFYSQMGTVYAMACTLCLLSTDALLSLVRSARGDHGGPARPLLRTALTYVAWTALAIYSHLGSLAIVLGQIASLPVLMYSARAERGLRLAGLVKVGAVIGVAGTLGIALYSPAFGAMMTFRDKWTQGGFTLDFLPLLLTAVSGGRGASIYAFLTVAVVGVLSTARSEHRREYLSVVLLVPMGVVAFYWVNDSSHNAWAHVRFFFVALPSALIAVASGLAILSSAQGLRSGRFVSAGAACLLLVVIGWSQAWKVAQVAAGPKDARTRELLQYVDEHLPPDTLIVSMPMRYSALRYYHDIHADGSSELVRHEQLIDELPGSKTERLRLDRPLAIAVDLVPFEGQAWEADWVVRRYGSTTLLHRPQPQTTKTRRSLRELLDVVGRVLDHLEAPDGSRNLDWVYWRIDEGHQHLFKRGALLATYRAFHEALRGHLPSAPKRPEARQAPDPDFWAMLAPHVDFWPAGR
jgi:hypothetical protein